MPSQSLIHQVIYSVPGKEEIRKQFGKVSIPYSSGHLFRSKILPDISIGCGGSQSLIHQVIYSVPDEEGSSQGSYPCLNPLFIRSSIPFSGRAGRIAARSAGVSIPYSSGHLFRSL